VTTFAAVFLVDRLGRRVLLLVGVGIMSLALALIAISFQYLSDTCATRSSLILASFRIVSHSPLAAAWPLASALACSPSLLALKLVLVVLCAPYRLALRFSS